MALGNAWHFPGNPEPFGNAGMRDPVFPTDPVSAVTVFSGNQCQGGGNPGNQLQDGSAVSFKQTTDTTWTTVPMVFATAIGNNKYYSAQIPAGAFAIGTVIQYYLVIAYDDHDTTFLGADATNMLSVATGEEAAAQAAPFTFTIETPDEDDEDDRSVDVLPNKAPDILAYLKAWLEDADRDPLWCACLSSDADTVESCLYSIDPSARIVPITLDGGASQVLEPIVRLLNPTLAALDLKPIDYENIMTSLGGVWNPEARYRSEEFQGTEGERRWREKKAEIRRVFPRATPGLTICCVISPGANDAGRTRATVAALRMSAYYISYRGSSPLIVIDLANAYEALDDSYANPSWVTQYLFQLVRIRESASDVES